MDVLADVSNVVVAEAAVVEALHRVVVVQAILSTGRALDVPADELQAFSFGDCLGEERLARARLPSDQQWLLQHQRTSNSGLERWIGEVRGCAAEVLQIRLPRIGAHAAIVWQPLAKVTQWYGCKTCRETAIPPGNFGREVAGGLPRLDSNQ